MRPDDDELAVAMRALDPARTPELSALTPAQLALRDRITATRVRPPHRRPALWMAAGLPAAAVLVVALVVVFTFTPSHRAFAQSPPPLRFAPLAQTTEEVLHMARTALQDKPGPATAQRRSVSLGWFANATDDGDPAQRVVICPELTTFEWDADQSGRVTIVAAEPYWADDPSASVPADAAPAPGTVLSDTTYAPGTFGALTVEPPPATREGLPSWLTLMGLPAVHDAADLVDAMYTAFNYWDLTDEQHAALLELLLTRDDVAVAGSTKDRAGRDVIGISTDSDRYPGVRKIVLISSDSGRIIGMETIRITAGENRPAGSVLDYTLWDPPLP